MADGRWQIASCWLEVAMQANMNLGVLCRLLLPLSTLSLLEAACRWLSTRQKAAKIVGDSAFRINSLSILYIRVPHLLPPPPDFHGSGVCSFRPCSLGCEVSRLNVVERYPMLLFLMNSFLSL